MNQFRIRYRDAVKGITTIYADCCSASPTCHDYYFERKEGESFKVVARIPHEVVASIHEMSANSPTNTDETTE